MKKFLEHQMQGDKVKFYKSIRIKVEDIIVKDEKFTDVTKNSLI